MRFAPTVGVSVVIALLLLMGCGSSTKTSTSTNQNPTTSTSKPKPVAGSGKTLVSQAKLKSALLTVGEAGAGWTLVASGTSSRSVGPGPSTSKPASGSGPTRANVKTSPECKAVLKNFDPTAKIDKTVARVGFTKSDRTSLGQSVVSSTSGKSQPGSDRAGLAKCKNITISTGVGTATLGLSILPLPKLGDDSLGVKLTITATGQGKKLTQNAYMAEIQRGNTLDTLILADGASPDGSVTPVKSDQLAPLARAADAKVAKIT
jgi:hypothetical protein